MLQWMGGSRKKVTTSRMSTQKRQKQYFEQRKRRQQNLQMMGSDNCSDSISISGQNPKEHRSLDILNLLNLSTNAQKCDSSCLKQGRDDGENNVSTMPGSILTNQPLMFANTNATVDSYRFEEARAHLCCQIETSPKKVLASAPDHQHAASNGPPSQSKTITDPYSELSVIDLLCDDERNATVEKCPTCEDHVSFSLEGLGKVGIETPVHSPEQQRIPSCYSPLLKDGRKSKLKNLDHVLDDIELEVDTMMQDIKVCPFNSSNFPYNKVKQSSAIAGDCKDYYDHGNQNGSSISEEFFYKTENSREDIWNAGSSFLDEKFDNEEGFDTSWKKTFQMGSRSPEFSKRGACKMGSYAFEDLMPKKWSSAAATKEINMREPQASFFKDKLENDFDFYMASGARTARCSGLDENFNAQNLVPEDVKDNSSLLSDELSSSTAVRGEAIKHSSSGIVTEENRRNHRNAFVSPRNNCSTKEEKCRSMPNPSKRKSSHYSNSILQEELGAHNSWQFEERYVSVDRSSVATSFCQDLEANLAVFGSKNNTDPFGVFTTTPELHNKPSASSGGSKKAVPQEDSPRCSFTSNKFAFASSTSFPNAESWPISPSLSPDIQFKGKPHDAADFRETSSADLSVQGSISKGERKVKLQKDRCSKTFEQGEDIFMGDNELSSGKKMERGASTSDNHTQECEGTEDTNPKTIEFLETDDSPGHVEEISSSLKKAEKHEIGADKKKSSCDAETPLKYKITKEEEMKSWHEGRNRVSGKHENEHTSLSGQVMFESYVFQLLCVQKVLKAACTTSTRRNNAFFGPGSDAIPHQT